MKHHHGVRILCAAALVWLMSGPALAAEQTHRAYLSGYPDGSIRPDAPVTRAQLVCVLARLAEAPLPDQPRASFFDLPGRHWAFPAAQALAELVPFGTGGWFQPDAAVSWQTLCEVFDALAASEDGRALFPALTDAWAQKTVIEAGQGDAARSAPVSRAELARAVNSLLGRTPDPSDPQLMAAAWYWDNQDADAWYFAELTEASADHTCCVPDAAERWTAIG